MSFWLYPEILPRDLLGKALVHKEFILPAEGLPDLARATAPQQIQEWLAKISPETTPEERTHKAEHYWRLGHEITPEDYLVLPAQKGIFMMGEVTGPYRFEMREGKGVHLWPVTWLSARVSQAEVPQINSYLLRGTFTEITDEDVLSRFRSHIPSQRRLAVTVFKWIAVITLISELIYFWPR